MSSIVVCPNPVGITNGAIVAGTTNYTEGVRVYYSCNAGFTMAGSTSQLCRSGAWSGAAPTCTQTTDRTNIQVSGLDMPLWLFITLVVLLAVFLLCLALALIIYICCRYCRCGSECCRGCFRKTRRGAVDRNSFRREDRQYYHQSATKGQSTRNPLWLGQSSEAQRRGKASHQSEQTKGTNTRIIRVLPGEPFVIVPDDTEDTASNRENGAAVTGNKDNARMNNNLTRSDEMILVPYSVSQPPADHGNRFKSRATQLKHANMWMPHSQPIRNDASHFNTTTR